MPVHYNISSELNITSDVKSIYELKSLDIDAEINKE